MWETRPAAITQLCVVTHFFKCTNFFLWDFPSRENASAKCFMNGDQHIVDPHAVMHRPLPSMNFWSLIKWLRYFFTLPQAPQYLWEPGPYRYLISLYHMGISSMNDAISLIITLYYSLSLQSHCPPQTPAHCVFLITHLLSGERAREETVKTQNV